MSDLTPDWLKADAPFASLTVSTAPVRTLRSLVTRLKATARKMRRPRVYFAFSCLLLAVAGYGYAKAWLEEKQYEAAVEHWDDWAGV